MPPETESERVGGKMTDRLLTLALSYLLTQFPHITGPQGTKSASVRACCRREHRHVSASLWTECCQVRERERETACVVRLGSVWATVGIAFGSTRSCSGSGSTTVSVLCNNRLQGREVQSSACTEMSAVLNPRSCSTYLTWDTE